MCGLFGTIGPVPNKLALLRALSVLNMERGTDSTGIASINAQTNSFTIRKSPTDANKFWPQIKLTSAGDCVIGHTRHATSGAVNTQNAHPWKIHKIIGAHNGMVWNEHGVKRYLKEVYNDDVKYEVDSQYLLHMMAHYGNLGNASGMLNLTYWDMQESQLVMVAYKNPLNIAFDIKNRWGFWTSDASHMKQIVQSYPAEVVVHSLAEEVLNIGFNKRTLTCDISKVPFDEKYKDSYSYNDYGYEYYNQSSSCNNKWWDRSKMTQAELDAEDEYLFGYGKYSKKKEVTHVNATTPSSCDEDYPTNLSWYRD